MIATPFAAFGCVLFLCSATPGEVRAVKINEAGVYTNGYYFYFKGTAKSTILETGEQLADRTPGWLNSEHQDQAAMTIGALEVTYSEPTSWVCIPTEKNIDRMPTLSSLVIEQNQTSMIMQGSNLFLVDGTLSIGEKQFTGPCKIRIRSGDVEVYANSTVYILNFL